MKKRLILAILALCCIGVTACKADGESSVKKPSSSTPEGSSVGEIELPEDKFD